MVVSLSHYLSRSDPLSTVSRVEAGPRHRRPLQLIAQEPPPTTIEVNVAIGHLIYFYCFVCYFNRFYSWLQVYLSITNLVALVMIARSLSRPHSRPRGDLLKDHVCSLVDCLAAR